MNEQKPNMFIPALIGGGIAGFLSGVPLVNCLCCLWIIGGAILAAYLLQRDSKTPLTSGDGAIVGALSGIIAAVVDAIVSIPFQALSNDIFRKMMDWAAEYADDIPEGWEKWLEQGNMDMTLPWIFLGFLITAVIFASLGALGGIIGVSVIKKPAKPGQEVIDVSEKDSGDRKS